MSSYNIIPEASPYLTEPAAPAFHRLMQAVWRRSGKAKRCYSGTAEAAQAPLDIVGRPSENSRIRCMAAQIILERMCGKAQQPLDAEDNDKREPEPIIIKFGGILDEWAK